jgi:hypothetical protein
MVGIILHLKGLSGELHRFMGYIWAGLDGWQILMLDDPGAGLGHWPFVFLSMLIFLFTRVGDLRSI